MPYILRLHFLVLSLRLRGRWCPERIEPTPLLVVHMRENLLFGRRMIELRPQPLSAMPNLFPPPEVPVYQNFKGCSRILLTWSLASQPNRP
ncbi:hypothetical protein AXF42_Ash001496 [Apostasia shenzhenica]|uniref:Secreted protein n=1 Tax=Apostasia shenzhenica TaxID=1088818 RepID=A0A2I0AAH0_9ASPA|nr:hypothetical protein AXF42_Ash001496 [Apostasia shenzhenica]